MQLLELLTYRFGLFSGFDALLVIFFILYILEQIRHGVFYSVINLLSIIISFLAGFLLYPHIASWVSEFLNIPKGIANAASFLFVTIVIWMIIITLAVVLRDFFRLNFHKTVNIFSGVLFGSASYLFLASFIILLITSFPTSTTLKASIRDSYFGKNLMLQPQIIESIIREVFGEAIDETINFLTIKPDTNQTVRLRFQVDNPTPDTFSEKEMFVDINKKRNEQDLPTLFWDDTLSQAARAHARDMAKRGYFSHYSLDGKSPFDRLENYPVTFLATGENLALAPDWSFAMQGLMRSKGHRENILSSEFSRLGVGVVDMGLYGKMFVQEFAD